MEDASNQTVVCKFSLASNVLFRSAFVNDFGKGRGKFSNILYSSLNIGKGSNNPLMPSNIHFSHENLSLKIHTF